ncbi:MAG: helix-turn-helix domain-containing protein [Nocardioidaceae bacterium]|nr:helix-turn-helix domain-containing protein [Nocardioidaceae bacterium]
MSSDSDLRKWVTDFVAAFSQRSAVETWVDRISTRIIDEVGEVRNDPVIRATVRAACDAHWRAFLANLGQPRQTFHLVQEARDMPLLVAQHGYGVPVVFAIYAAAEQAQWEFITETVKDHRGQGVSEADALVYFWTRSSIWFDRSVEQSVVLYQDELERIRQGDAARRLEVVRSVLGGARPEPHEASSQLGGHVVSAQQTALLLHTVEDAMIAGLPRAAQRLAKSVGLRQPLIVHPGGRDLWAWMSSADAPDLDPLHECRDWLGELHIVATVGTTAAGLDGFVSSHQEAMAALQLSLAQDRPPPLTFFADVELMTLIGNTAAMRRFVGRVLGRLVGPDESATRFRETLRILLSSGSVDAAAHRLSVHKNTVRYRVERAEHLMGKRLADASPEIEVALRCHEAFFGSAASDAAQH